MAQDIRGKVRKIRTLVDDPELVAQNRQLLIETATKLFRAKGFHNTSTRDIAINAGISVGAIYQYILHKEDLVVLILNSVVEIYEKTIFQAPVLSENPTLKLKNMIDIYYRTIDEHHAKTDLLYHNFSGFDLNTKKYLSTIEEQVRQIFENILTAGIQQGFFAPANTSFLAHNIVSMAHMWALKRSRFRSIMSVDEYIDQQYNMLMSVLKK